MFGSDAVARKFGETPPPEWAAALSRLSEIEVERGLRRLVYSGASHVPTLPEFMKLARTVGDSHEFGEPQSRQALPAPQYAGDAWEITANGHLLAFILAEWGRLKLSPTENRRATEIAVTAKKLWAADMRELAAKGGGTVPVDTQRAMWREYVDGVREEIARAAAA